MCHEGGSFIGRSFVEWASNNNEFKIIFSLLQLQGGPKWGLIEPKD